MACSAFRFLGARFLRFLMCIMAMTMAVAMACMVVEQNQTQEVARQTNTTNNQDQLRILNDYMWVRKEIHK